MLPIETLLTLLSEGNVVVFGPDDKVQEAYKAMSPAVASKVTWIPDSMLRGEGTMQ